MCWKHVTRGVVVTNFAVCFLLKLLLFGFIWGSVLCKYLFPAHVLVYVDGNRDEEDEDKQPKSQSNPGWRYPEEAMEVEKGRTWEREEVRRGEESIPINAKRRRRETNNIQQQCTV